MDWLGLAMDQELREPPEAALLHCDYSPRNILVDPQSHRVTGVIDFEAATRGDPQYDLAKSTWLSIGGDGRAGREREAFVSGWTETSGWQFDPRLHRIYEAMQGLAALAWARVEGEAEHATYGEQGALALQHAHRAART